MVQAVCKIVELKTTGRNVCSFRIPVAGWSQHCVICSGPGWLFHFIQSDQALNSDLYCWCEAVIKVLPSILCQIWIFFPSIFRSHVYGCQKRSGPLEPTLSVSLWWCYIGSQGHRKSFALIYCGSMVSRCFYIVSRCDVTDMWLSDVVVRTKAGQCLWVIGVDVCLEAYLLVGQPALSINMILAL